jgi:hypothetical protein
MSAVLDPTESVHSSVLRFPLIIATICAIHLAMTPPNPRPPEEELENNRNNGKAKSKGREDTRTDGNEKSITRRGTPDIRGIPDTAQNSGAGLTKGHGHWTVFASFHPTRGGCMLTGTF